MIKMQLRTTVLHTCSTAYNYFLRPNTYVFGSFFLRSKIFHLYCNLTTTRL